MPSMTINPEDLDALVRTGISGFAAVPGEKPRSQVLMERAIEGLHRIGETELAAAVMMIHCARAEGGTSLHDALGLLMQRHVTASEQRRWRIEAKPSSP